ncbi:MAG: hypothetical protein NTW60_01275 [Candidatus Wolfebacteria bacterium]|nr:hypothetical protein [Candidatus Wolfebacteria bacterium]
MILLLGAYLILYTINPDLVNMRFVLPALNVPADTTGGSSALAGYNRNDIQSGVRSTGSIAELASQATLTEATVRSNIKLNGSGLQILGGDTPCGQGIYSGTTKGCVSFDGARGATVNEMLYVADLIGGKNMIITSVTEGNHAAGEASHANGNKFDTQGTDGVNGKLDKFITQDQSRFESVGTRTDIDGKTLVPLFKNKETGAVWALEPNLTYTNSSGQTQTRPRHWDVQIK